MSKQIVLEGWCSIIPDKMYEKWLRLKLIKKGAVDIGTAGGEFDNVFMYVLYKGDESKTCRSKVELKALRADGWEMRRKIFQVTEATIEILHFEVGKWYKDVFLYVETWLKKNKFIDLQSGSFNGGFCAETDPNHEVVKNWGAPLAGPNNKVAQIKEKFGRIVVYFNGLTKQERAKIDRFAVSTEKKFDCICDFV